MQTFGRSNHKADPESALQVIIIYLMSLLECFDRTEPWLVLELHVNIKLCAMYTQMQNTPPLCLFTIGIQYQLPLNSIWSLLKRKQISCYFGFYLLCDVM